MWMEAPPSPHTSKTAEIAQNQKPGLLSETGIGLSSAPVYSEPGAEAMSP
jgi:hypothetical protein